jgi:hypothetical protein
MDPTDVSTITLPPPPGPHIVNPNCISPPAPPTTQPMSASRVFSATCSGPVNIAVLKYWGKASVAANTPTNPSLSVTLHQRDLRTVTTAAASAQFASGAAGSAAAGAADDGDRSDAALDALAHSDRLWLNGCEEQIPRDGRVAEVIRSVRRIAAREGDGAAAARCVGGCCL